MKKELTKIAGISGGAILLLPLLFVGSVHHLSDYLIGIGLSALGISVLWVFVGLIMLISQESRKMGQAFLLTAAVLFLVSFTLCSTNL